MTVEPPLPMNWALFVFQFVDVRDENAMLLTTVFAPPPVVIVSLTADVVRPVGVVVINSVQFVPDRKSTRLTSSHLVTSYAVFCLPDTITYSTAASTTVMATIRMVAITGDTAASSLRMMLFMVLSSCGLRRYAAGGTDRY